MTIPTRHEWRPRRPDPEHRKCGRCGRTFYAGTLPRHGPERAGPYAGSYICRDCRDAMTSPPSPPSDPMF